jgi:hypothetical protein
VGEARGRRAEKPSKRTAASLPEDETWLSRAADNASTLAGVPKELLGDYLLLLAEAATHGRRPRRAELEAVSMLGRRAAESGVSAGQAVSLYLSAARQVWGELPMVVRERNSAAVRAAADAVLQVIDDAVAVFADGHAQALRERVRHEETIRRELIEDLLRGEAHLGELVERAEPFGLDLTRTHQVALAAPGQRLPDIDAAASTLERIVLDRFGDRDALVATKEGQVVVLVPAEPREPARAQPHAATGLPHPGAYGIARSYEEAREAQTMAARLQLERPVIEAEDMLIYRVLFRDQPAITDLVHTVLSPLAQARGGPAGLLDTLEAYFATGGIATQAAARLHLSVRAVTYRLARVKTLTGYDPADPAQRFTVHAAVLGARALGWPNHELP